MTRPPDRVEARLQVPCEFLCVEQPACRNHAAIRPLVIRVKASNIFGIHGVVSSKPRRDRCRRFRGRHNGNDLEFGNVIPVCYPLIQQPSVFALHIWKQRRKSSVTQLPRMITRHQTPSIPEAPVLGTGLPPRNVSTTI